MRRVATDRAERQRAHEDEQRRLREQAEERRHQKAREEEDARVRRLEEDRRRALEAQHLEETVRQREEDARQRQAEEFQRTQAAVHNPADLTFDPYSVLGLTPDASDDDVRAAFDAARSKYDPQQVAHLGFDVRNHYKAKSRAVERAYRMLDIDAGAPAVSAGDGELHQPIDAGVPSPTIT